MGRNFTFGVVGGYGATGRAVAAELGKSCGGAILLGGRDLARATGAAAELDGRGTAARLEVLDAGSLEEFCGRCAIVVNCAGPVMMLQDRVAQAAFRARCHYVDAAGMSVVKERMAAHGGEIESAGLSFVISAGWMPGISELVPVYAATRARAEMEAIESLAIYFGDSGEWSANALRDAVWFIRQTGLRRAGYFRKGEWTRAKMSEASRRVDLGEPIGAGRFALFVTPEFEEIGRGFGDCDFFTYSYLSGLRTVAASILMAALPMPEGLGVRLMRGVFRRNQLPVDGFAAAEVLGSLQGRKQSLRVQIVYRERRDYWIHGVALAAAARLIAAGKGVRSGVHFLAEAVEPIGFMAELTRAGVEVIEKIEPRE
jgi:saccharopine dehydrogenase (NAD+, L-lysine forming)